MGEVIKAKDYKCVHCKSRDAYYFNRRGNDLTPVCILHAALTSVEDVTTLYEDVPVDLLEGKGGAK